MTWYEPGYNKEIGKIHMDKMAKYELKKLENSLDQYFWNEAEERLMKLKIADKEVTIKMLRNM